MRAEQLEAAPDELLAIRASDGDVAAFEVLARRYQRMMHAYAWRLSSSSADADDAVQNALLLAWQRLPTLREPAAVRGWLMRIVGRSATDLVRRRHPAADIDAAEQVAEEGTSGADPGVHAEMSHAVRSLAQALWRLPPLQRVCWVLREVGGESYGEIAGQLGTTTASVRGALARARVTLLAEMEEWR